MKVLWSRLERRLRKSAVGILASTVIALPALAQETVPGEYIIKMKGRPSSARSAGFLGKISNKAHLKGTFGKLNMHHVRLQNGADHKAFLSEVQNDPDVEYVEPNYILKKIDGQATDDSRVYSIEEAQSVTSQSVGTYSQSGPNTKVTQAWGAMSASASDVPVVAIIDTGLDYNHSIFVNSNAIWRNPGEIANNSIDDDGNGYIDDTMGWNFFAGNKLPFDDDEHGTHVAGIVLGVTQDIFASPMAAAKIKIMPLKFLGADGSGSTSNAVSAIYYAVNNGANIINNSWGGSTYSQSLHDAVTYAYTHHVAVISAAGNYGSNNDATPLYPANYPVPSNMAVAATTDYDNLASFSNYGKTSVRIAAPGVSIYSTVPGNGFKYMSGTSMAAPFVAGMAAVALREAPNLTGYQIVNLLANSGSHLSQLVPTTITGNRGDGYQSVLSAKAQTGTQPDQPAYVAAANRAPASDSGKAGGCGAVALLGKTFFNPTDPPPQSLILIVALSLVPLLVWQVLRSRAATGANRRRHERFSMNSEIKVRVGERELVGQMNTISLGGLSFKAADAMLEKGGVVTLQIASPDGKEQLQVEGRIVWSEESKGYGVQFQGAREGVIERIRGWTTNLVKSAS